MTITIHWWWGVLILLAIPIVYASFRKPRGAWDLRIDIMLIFAACWPSAAMLALSKLLG